MPQSLTPFTVQRLAYIRFIYQEGIEQSRQPSILSARALTSFHDATENFLGLIVEHLGVDVRKAPDFLGYWELVKPKYELPNKAVMRRLNDWRVALKHNGTFPSEHQIEQARAAVSGFFTTVTADVFGVEFESIDMVDLVTQPETARLVREARTHADRGDHVGGLAGLSLAFEALRRHYAGGHVWDAWDQTPFSFGPSLGPGDEPRFRYADQSTARLRKTTIIATQVREAMQVLSLGIDFPSYARFKVIAPQMETYGDGTYRYAVTPWQEARTADDYNWAEHFVIESALRAGRADGVQELAEERGKSFEQQPWPVPERTWTGPATD